MLTAEGSRGRLWNWRVKPEENQRQGVEIRRSGRHLHVAAEGWNSPIAQLTSFASVAYLLEPKPCRCSRTSFQDTRAIDGNLLVRRGCFAVNNGRCV